MEKINNKRTAPLHYLPFLAATFLLILAAVGVYADTQDTLDITINVQSAAPSITAVTDNGSSVSTPTNVGEDVTFTATAH